MPMIVLFLLALLPLAELPYGIAVRFAYEQRLPLVTFHQTPMRKIKGVVVCRHDTLAGYDGPAVLIAVPGDGLMVGRGAVDAWATDAEILARCR